MRISTVNKKGNGNINEDAYVVNEKAGVFAAIDGATGLEGVPGNIASHAVRDTLASAAEEELFDELVEAANLQVAEETLNWLGSDDPAEINDVPKGKRSTCALAAISIDRERLSLEYAHAADCMIFLQYANGDIRTVTYDLLSHFDQKAINEIVKLRSGQTKKTPISEARKEVRSTLIENRALLNTDAGYSVIDGSKEAMKHLESGRLSLKKVTAILLLSDGLMMPTGLEEADGWEQSANIAFQYGVDRLVSAVEERENDDPECITYPRLKMKDDKTAVLIEIGS
ncbi:protein phosphatase 2C domain-containing protein [Salimicrobium album]|uniref:Protein phosphatase 2C n=1 Tax=Salimicrobium album TaxID=50717 RepID=A0A1H3HZK7_9BACI|nr:protein phosphatase 2C domain-containing protein [Salimicrobium album]SDY20802.1 Protein phosphatase 2C [Salimicrobium album]